MNLLLACCCDVPTVDEAKFFRLEMPWTLFPQVDDMAGADAYNSTTHNWIAYRTGQWCFTKFTKLTITEVNHTGTRTVVKQWDQDSGTSYTDSITAPGGFTSYNGNSSGTLAGPNGINGTGITDTDFTTSFERVLDFDYSYTGAIPTPPFVGTINDSGTVTYLFEDPIYFDAQMTAFRARLEALCPLEDMKEIQTITIPVYTGSTFLNSDFQLMFYSQIPGGSSYKSNHVFVSPSPTAPWDNTYRAIVPGEFSGLARAYIPLGASPFFYATTAVDSQLGYGHIVSFDTCYLIAGCISVVTPINCDNPDLYLNDVVVVESSLDDGGDTAMTIGSGGVEISKGWHAFNGVRTHSFSGSITGQTDLTSGAYGWVDFRVDLEDPGTSHPEIYTTNHAPDNCPP